jgi:cellulose synthase/poly-beta-1,6-N-acetylglucosamine synthase-like glycosyltransferase
VVSDGSTDATDAIVKEYSSRGVKLKAFRQRAGKTVALAGTVGEAAGEIIVFSDANGMYRKDAVKKLAGNFHDGTVGCVCGNLVYTGSDRGENVYWNFERMIKKYENRAGSILGAAGSIFAVRKELYVPLKVPVVDDFIEPLMILKKGYKVLFEPEAVSVEEMAASITGEYARKVRIITSSISGISNIGELFNPLKYGLFSLQLVSHKMLRWLAPFFLIALFTANLFLLSGVFYRVTMAVQVILCLLGLAGFFLDRKDVNIKIFSIPLYFMVVNLAALNAWYNFILGEKMIKWDTDRI